MTAIQWYFARGDQQCGPVTSSELKRLAEQGELPPEALVWRDGMKEWIPARSVKGLFEGEAALPRASPLSDAPPVPEPPPVRTMLPTFERSPAAFQRSREGKPSHLFDFLLASARARFTPQFVESAARLFAWIGHYGLYLAMLGVIAFDAYCAIHVLKKALPAVLGLAEVLLLLALQYSARRFLAASERLNRAGTAKMGSSALSDSCAIVCALSGLAILVGVTVWAIYEKSFLSISTAVAGFIVFEYLAVAALNPEALNLSIASDVNVDEETLGAFSFVLKLGLRAAPVLFGVGVFWAMFALAQAAIPSGSKPASAQPGLGFGLDTSALAGYANLMKELTAPYGVDVPATPTGGSLPALRTGSPGALAEIALIFAPKIRLFLAAALPILGYFAFLGLHLLIDVLYAILSVPVKLDRLRTDRTNDEGESQ